MTDKEFNYNIKLIKNKDKAGLKTIYVEYVSLIYHTVLNIIKQKEDAEDITSDFFIKFINEMFDHICCTANTKKTY